MEKVTTLTVREPTGISRRGDVLVSGVPLPRGVACDPDCLVLRDRAGKRLRAQAEALARWPDGSVKWALLTVPRISIEGGKQTKLTLEHGRPVTAKGGLVLRRTRSGLRVDTGRLRFTIAREGTLIRKVESRRGKEWSVRAGDLDLTTVVERGSQSTSYAASRASREIEVETAGPLRAAVAVRGVHQAESGRTFGPYILRFEVLADSAHLRLTHSVMYDGDPWKDFVRASEIVLQAKVGDDQRFAVGGDEGREVRFQRQRADWAPDFRHAELYQDSATHWRLRRWAERERREVFCAEGLRTDGWLELSGTAGRVAVAVRECWQNHPKSLAADAATGEIRVGLYPRHADRLDLQRYSDLTYPNTYETPSFTHRDPIRYDRAAGAHGIRKTHHVLLAFDEANPSAVTLFYNEPLLCEWSPAYTARTKVVLPAAKRLNAAWSRRLGEYLDLAHEAMLCDGGTGYLDYFDLPHGYNVEEGRWYHDFGGWGYCNDESLPCLGLWQSYLLTWRRDAFAMARAMTLHNADIDSFYAGPHAGLGSRHNVNHWGCMDKEPRISQPVGKRFLYYLTGDRSVLDLTRVMMDMWRRRFPRPEAMNIRAEMPALVSSLLFAAETGLEDAADWLGQIADAFTAATNELGQMGASLVIDAAKGTAEPGEGVQPEGFGMLSQFGGTQTMPELAEYLDHQPLRDALVRMARYQVLDVTEQRKVESFNANNPYSRSQNVLRALDLIAYAYSQTGDPSLARYAARHLRHACIAIQEKPEARYGVPGAGSRRVPVYVDWPDADPEMWKEAHSVNFFPLFSWQSRGQMVRMAQYLHKMQGIMLLSEAGQPPRRRRKQ